MTIKKKQPFWVMNDRQVRDALKRRIIAQRMKANSSVLLEEVGLGHGAVKADLVLVGKTLHGFEIKSDGDTLNRLADQVRFYSSVFDRVTLVVGYRHAYEALHLVPEWWGVAVVHKDSRSAIHFADARAAHRNPLPDIDAVVKLLWREEALAFLSRIGQADGMRSKNRAAIYGRIASGANVASVMSWVCDKFKCRAGWKSGVPRKPCDG